MAVTQCLSRSLAMVLGRSRTAHLSSHLCRWAATGPELGSCTSPGSVAPQRRCSYVPRSSLPLPPFILPAGAKKRLLLPTVKLPFFLVYLFACLVELFCALLALCPPLRRRLLGDAQPVLNRVSVTLICTSVSTNSDKLRRALGWEPPVTQAEAYRSAWPGERGRKKGRFQRDCDKMLVTRPD